MQIAKHLVPTLRVGTHLSRRSASAGTPVADAERRKAPVPMRSMGTRRYLLSSRSHAPRGNGELSSRSHAPRGNGELRLFFCLLLLSLLTGCGGCHDPATTPTASDQESPAASSQSREELLTYAIDNLDRLDEFGSANVLPQILNRLNELNQPKPEGSDRPFDPLLAVWPETEMLRQIVARLNQWIRPQRPLADWKPDPMIASLPKPLAGLPQVKNLGQMEFTRFDGYALQEAVWLRDVSLWARGNMLDDLERAKSLFDWTVRNIQIDPESPERIPLFPWETLLFGRGTATERAWVFILLLRQLDIDAALLVLDDARGLGTSVPSETRGGTGLASGPSEPGKPNSPEETPDGPPRPWCVGVLIEGKVYLFDPLLGLPIPAPDGVARDETGQLTIRPATLAEVRSDNKLLERMNAGPSRVYGVQASDLDNVTALLEASPPYLARCMKMLESRLAGDRKMVLTTSPSANARRWTEAAGLADVRLWQHPFQTLLRRSNLDRRQVQARLLAMLQFHVIPAAPLSRGRILYLKGKLVGDDGAMQYYQAARPSNAELRASSVDQVEKLMLLRGKQDATYWCGLIAYQRGDYEAAVDYFMKRTLETYPDGPWTGGGRYNLARAYEASDQTERAILMYGLDASSSGYLGNLLRAKWLREESEGKKPKDE